MVAKVRIKAGPIEFEYEGETELGVADIKDLFTHIETLFKVPILAEGGEPHVYAAPSNLPQAEQKPTAPTHKLHINSIAEKLKGKTGSELAVAAAASLQIFDRQDTFTRSDLLATMKKATKYYNNNMSSNLTKILETLIGPKFNQISDGVYSLNADEYSKLASNLA